MKPNLTLRFDESSTWDGETPLADPRALGLAWTDCSWSLEISAHPSGPPIQHLSSLRRIDMNRESDMANHRKPTRRHRTMKALIIYDDFASAVKASTVLLRAAHRAKLVAQCYIRPLP